MDEQSTKKLSKTNCVKEIEKMKKNREERRVRDNEKRQELLDKKVSNEAMGRFGRRG